MDAPLPCNAGALAIIPRALLLRFCACLLTVFAGAPTPLSEAAPTADSAARMRDLFPAPSLPQLDEFDEHYEHGEEGLQDSSLPAFEPAENQPCANWLRPGDEIWYISARHHGHSCDEDGLPPLRVWRYDSASDALLETTLEDFFAADDPDVLTVFYVHGARVTESGAIERTPQVYCRFTAGIAVQQHVRMVLFSWPNPQTKHIVSDFRVAEAEGDRHGRTFGRILAAIDPRVKLSICTFSLGAQIACAGLQELVELDTGEKRPVRQVRTVFWSAAVDNTLLLPGRRYDLAVDAVDRMLIVTNHRDPVNKRFYLMNCSRPEALGCAGLTGIGLLGIRGRRISEYDASCSLGVSHGYARNLKSQDVVDLTRAYVLWHNVDGRIDDRAEPVIACPRLPEPTHHEELAHGPRSDADYRRRHGT